MYACIHGIGSGFFEAVCTPSNATVNFRDPPPRLPLDARIDSGRYDLAVTTVQVHAGPGVRYCLFAARYHSFTCESRASTRRLSSTYARNHSVSPTPGS